MRIAAERAIGDTSRCRTCGGHGAGLADRAVMCPECRWLRPLVPGYQVDPSAFAWAADAKAMARLRAITPLNAAARAVSEKVGRRWIEVTFNGVRLGERQMPQVFGQAVRAARILGMSHMPDVYLSGERPWDMLTFGTDTDSFIVVGSAMAGNFQGVDMLFLLARELGHCKAGHALWKTVIRFFLGEQGPAKGFMAGGIFNAIFSPTALIGGAIEMPLLAWARQADITADRAGLLTVGNEETARRVLLSWSLKSAQLYRQLNIDAWLEQQAQDVGDMLRLSELTTTSTPYIGPRLKLLTQYATSPELQGYLRIIGETIRSTAPGPVPAAAQTQQPRSLAPSAAAVFAATPARPRETPPDRQDASVSTPSERGEARGSPVTTGAPEAPARSDSGGLRVPCATCGTAMRVPVAAFRGVTELPVRCPAPDCGAITHLEKRMPRGGTQPMAAPVRQRQEEMHYGD